MRVRHDQLTEWLPWNYRFETEWGELNYRAWLRRESERLNRKQLIPRELNVRTRVWHGITELSMWETVRP